MAEALRWDLYGNDQLTSVLDRLARATEGLARKFDSATSQATQMGRGFDGTARAADHLGDEMSQAGRQAETMSVKMSTADRISRATSGTLNRTSTMLEGAIATLRSYGAATLLALATGAGAAAGYGVKVAAANETASVGFEVMLGSAQKAKAFLADLQAFAAATPFELPQLRDAAARLLAVGLETRRVIPLMTVLGDVTAGMGTGAVGIERSITALTQMRQKTKVTAEEMLQLTEAGIPAWQSLAAELHTNVANAMQLVTERSVAADVMFQALEHHAGDGLKRLTGMMERQSQTLSGMWSTFKDNAGQALATFMQPALPAMKRGLEVASQLIPQALVRMQRGGHQIADIFKGSDVPGRLAESLRKVSREILPEAEKAWNRVLGAIRDNREGLEKFGRFVSDIVVPLMGGALVNGIRATGYAAEYLITVVANLTDVITAFTTTALEEFRIFIHAMANAFSWVPILGPKMEEARNTFDEFADHVESKLASLDGRTVSVRVVGKVERDAGYSDFRAGERTTAGSSSSLGAAPTKRRAQGGWAPADELIQVHEQETVVLPRPGFVIPASGRFPGGGGSTEMLAPVTITLEGHGVWQGLIRFKKRTGKTTLGLG